MYLSIFFKSINSRLSMIHGHSEYIANLSLLDENKIRSVIRSQTVNQGSNFTLTAKENNIQAMYESYHVCCYSTVKLQDGFNTITCLCIQCCQNARAVSIAPPIVLLVYNIEICLFDQNKQQLICFQVDVYISFIPKETNMMLIKS